MIEVDIAAVGNWLETTFRGIAETDPATLAKYVLAVLKNYKPSTDLRKTLTNKLGEFLGGQTESFVSRFLIYLKAQGAKFDDPSAPAPAVAPTPAAVPVSASSSRDSYDPTNPNFNPNPNPVPLPAPVPTAPQSSSYAQQPRGDYRGDRSHDRDRSDRAGGADRFDRSSHPQHRQQQHQHQHQQQQQQSHGDDGRTLLVENLPREKLNQQVLESYFSQFGTVTNIHMLREPGKAHVQFASTAEAEAAWRSREAVCGDRFAKVFWAGNRPEGVAPLYGTKRPRDQQQHQHQQYQQQDDQQQQQRGGFSRGGDREYRDSSYVPHHQQQQQYRNPRSQYQQRDQYGGQYGYADQMYPQQQQQQQFQRYDDAEEQGEYAREGAPGAAGGAGEEEGVPQQQQEEAEDVQNVLLTKIKAEIEKRKARVEALSKEHEELKQRESKGENVHDDLIKTAQELKKELESLVEKSQQRKRIEDLQKKAQLQEKDSVQERPAKVPRYNAPQAHAQQQAMSYYGMYGQQYPGMGMGMPMGMGMGMGRGGRGMAMGYMGMPGMGGMGGMGYGAPRGAAGAGAKRTLDKRPKVVSLNALPDELCNEEALRAVFGHLQGLTSIRVDPTSKSALVEWDTRAIAEKAFKHAQEHLADAQPGWAKLSQLQQEQGAQGEEHAEEQDLHGADGADGQQGGEDEGQ